MQLADGVYTKVFVHVGEVTGELADNGESISIKLPSSKLQINKPFVIEEGDPAVDFVFDIAVVAAGNEKSPEGIKYLLQPVIGESGADQPFKEAHGEAHDEPEAEDDAYDVDEGGTLIVDAASGVLANDTDPQDDPLEAVLLSDVSNGTLTLNADGSFTYEHDGGETTEDSFTYKANDGTSDSDPATVTITVTAS